jgi:hypothetical protein
VLTRSGHYPILTGLSAAAVIVIATASPTVAGATPSPDPQTATPTATPAASDTPESAATPTQTVTATPTRTATATPTQTATPAQTMSPAPPPPVPELEVSTTPVTGTVRPGDKVTLFVVAHADKAVAHKATLSLSTRPKAVTTPTASHDLGNLTTSNKTVTVTVTVPTTMKPGKLTLTAKVSATIDKATPVSAIRTITVTAAAKTTTKTMTTKATTKTAPVAAGLPAAPLGGGVGALSPPSPAGSIQPAAVPGVALPQIAVATPSAAAPSGLSGSTMTMRDGSPDAQELTFQRLASTQAAWLAALLVTFSVLLTQVRLVGTRSARPRPKGGHRRSHRGLFEDQQPDR